MNDRRLLLSAIGLLLCCGLAAEARAQDEVIELVVGLLKEQDKEIRALAFDQIRNEVKGEAATKKFADLLSQYPPETQVGLLSALADRGDIAAAPAVRKLLAENKDDAVRIAAIKALGPLGGNEDLKPLVEALAADSEAVRDAARDSLTKLPGDASAGMIAALKDSPAAVRVALLPILTARRAREAVSVMTELAGVEDPAVRSAALTALAELGDAEDVPRLVPLIFQAAPGRERDAVEKSIAAVCLRQSDKQQLAAPVLAEFEKSDELARGVLLSTLGRIGGSAALAAVDKAVHSNDANLHAGGIQALCNWPDGTVVSRLLQIARTHPEANIRKAAFQALIRIAPLADEREDKRRLDTVRTVFALCASDAERNQVLNRAKAIRNVETLRYLLPFFDQPQFAQQAALSAVELAHHSSLRESNKEEFMAALDRIQKVSKDPVVIDRAQRYKTGQTWYRPKNSE